MPNDIDAVVRELREKRKAAGGITTSDRIMCGGCRCEKCSAVKAWGDACITHMPAILEALD